MGQITSSTGLVSGIDTGSIIKQLIALEQQPKTILQGRVSAAQAQKQAYTDLSTQLTALQQLGQAFERPSTFAASTAKSADENVLTATAGAGAAVGSYQFQVARLVTAQQAITNGFASGDALVGAGTISVTMGGGSLKSPTNLSQLNGGTGVRRGQFRITDGSGSSTVVDISAAVTLDDVVKKINTSLDVSVRASIKDNHLVLQDTSGQSTARFVVQDLGDGHAAGDLGIVGNTAGATITGTGINTISANTALASLNDGRGVRTAAGASDFQINLSDGTNVQVTLGGAQTVGDAITAINKNAGGKFKATLNTTTNAIDLTDTAGGPGTLSVAAVNNSGAAKDLGILGGGTGTTIRGGPLLAGLDSVLVSSLNGGAGLPLGKISLTDRAGQSATVDLSGAKSFQDILDTINNASVGVTASLNNAGDGIQLQDTTGGGGNLVVGDVNSTTAQALGIKGTFDTSKQVVSGGNLHLQFVSENTLLSKYNGGKGVTPGSFQITNSQGSQATVDLSTGTFNTIGDVIKAINAKGLGVTASINANGDGIQLADTAGGATKLTVTGVSGTTAADLNIAGTAAGTTIDGSFTKSMSVTATDTLATVQTKIQTLGWGIAANLVNDGSGVNGYHLSLTSTNSGRAGQFVFDSGATNLQANNLVEGQDAAVFYGGAGAGAGSLLVTSSTNQLTGVIPGVNIQLHGTSSAPVSLNVSRDPTSLTDKMQKFTDGFNGIVDKISDLTKFDTKTNSAGLLLGESTVQDVQFQMYTVFQGVVSGAGRYKLLSDVGVTLGDGAKIQFDADKFNAAFATDPDAVKNLFTQATTGLGAMIDKSMTALVDPVNGSITQENKTLDGRVQQFNDRITAMDALIADKQTRLEQQFANMETILSQLQGQQSAMASLTGVTTTSSKSK